MGSSVFETWEARGFTERDMWDWNALGVDSVTRAEEWIEMGYCRSDVDLLGDVSITEPSEAKIWSEAGVSAWDVCLSIDAGLKTPEERTLWLSHEVDIMAVAMFKRLGYTAEEAGRATGQMIADGRKGQERLIEVAAMVRSKNPTDTAVGAVLDVHLAPMISVRLAYNNDAIAAMFKELDHKDLKNLVTFIEREYTSETEVDYETVVALAEVICEN